MGELALPIRSPSDRVFAGRAWSDERLARAVAKGDAGAFTLIYQRHHQALYRYCRAILRDEHDAQDALQSAMTRAFGALRGQERDLAVKPWLFRIAHNEAVTMLRKRRSTAALAETAEPIDLGVEPALQQRERLATLVDDLKELSERQRAALLMRELNGLSIEEIAGALSTSPGAAKQVLFEGRSALHDFAEGRAMECEQVRRAVSDEDRRSLRGRRLRAHLRACRGCRDFQAATTTRRADLHALAPPLAPAAATALLSRLLAGGTGGHAGGLAIGSGGLAGGSGGLAAGPGGLVGGSGAAAGGSAVASLAAKVAVCAVVAATAAGGARLAFVHNTPSRHSPAYSKARPAAPAAGAAAAAHGVAAVAHRPQAVANPGVAGNAKAAAEDRAAAINRGRRFANASPGARASGKAPSAHSTDGQAHGPSAVPRSRSTGVAGARSRGAATRSSGSSGHQRPRPAHGSKSRHRGGSSHDAHSGGARPQTASRQPSNAKAHSQPRGNAHPTTPPSATAPAPPEGAGAPAQQGRAQPGSARGAGAEAEGRSGARSNGRA